MRKLGVKYVILHLKKCNFVRNTSNHYLVKKFTKNGFKIILFKNMKNVPHNGCRSSNFRSL